MSLSRTIPRIAFALLAALAGPCPGAWAADGAEPPGTDSPDMKQVLIRKHIAAHASENPALREEARQALLKLGDDAALELARSIERSEVVRARLEETLKLIRDLELSPDQQKLLLSTRSIRMTLEIQEMPVSEVMEFLRQFNNMNFITTREVPVTAPITLKARNLPLENALNLIAEQIDAVWYLDGHAFVLAPVKQVEPRHQLWIRRHLDRRTDPKDPDVLALQKKMDNLKIDLNLDKARLEDAVEFVRQFSDLNMVIDPAVRGDKSVMDRPASFKMKDVLLSECLTMLLLQYGLAYSFRERVIYISRPPAQAK
jgi:type II secretory pathway component GspD/PulD (secretin)